MSDEELVEQPDTGMSVGAQLRAAREAKGISVDEMAARSRIPKRHLENLEADNWEKLPAPTYAAGFAKSYAQMVDIDPAWAAQAVREQMGAYTPEVTTSGVYEIADEKRGIPGWLIGLVKEPRDAGRRTLPRRARGGRAPPLHGRTAAGPARGARTEPAGRGWGQG